MGANLYGVASPLKLPIIVSGGADIVCNANVATPVLSASGLFAPSAGWFYPIIWGFLEVTMGASIPTNSNWGFNINGGSTVDFYQIDTNLTVANAYFGLNFALVGTPSNVIWRPPGSTINITVLPFTNAVTYRGYSSRAIIALFRAPDQ